MEDTLIITWKVEDDYIGKYRPQTTKLKITDFMDLEEWAELPVEEKKQLIEEAVQEDFEQKISFSINDYKL